ncbi:DUF4391 domain-containing protein [uncultured Jannaschia sp.]|uniref:DUF4391 domain-containing protein n=1 Tax=uncultured Jannaschia sp. TaxID=293347 RepID=UPI0026272635|nr:DUF4391 domain-containing protein [uncultured Jannaschia sp.]
MTGLFAWPQGARFDQRVPRDRLFAQAGGGKTIRALYADQVERITWTHKLFERSINLALGDGVEEIVVLEVALKGDRLDDKVLAHIDAALPRHTLFELRRGAEAAMAVAYKRQDESDASRMVVGPHVRQEWQPEDGPRVPLPPATHLGSLYAGLLRSLWPHPHRTGESLRDQAERVAAAMVERRKVDRMAGCVRRETSFARQVELNRELREAQRRLAALTQMKDA